MKKFIYIAFLLTSFLSFAQTVIPTGFDLQDPQPIDKKFLHSGATGRAAILNQFTGLFSVDVADSANPKLMVKGSGGWIAVGTQPAIPFLEAYTFTYTGSNNTITLGFAPAFTPLSVMLNGNFLDPFLDFSVSGSILTLSAAQTGLLTGVTYKINILYFKY